MCIVDIFSLSLTDHFLPLEISFDEILHYEDIIFPFVNKKYFEGRVLETMLISHPTANFLLINCFTMDS